MKEIEYNTDQWIIFNFLQAAGGKFLMNCFFQFDQVATWFPNPGSKQQRIDYYLSTLPGIGDPWGKEEMIQPWKLNFFSRTYPRGDSITEKEFNQIVNQGNYSEFHHAWNSKKYITEFWHKGYCPAWWTKANHISIIVDDWNLYKKLLFSKNYMYNPQTKEVICYHQMPTTGSESNKINKKQFQNQWFWKNVESIDEFFDNYIRPSEWFSTWDFNQTPSHDYILLSELFDVNRVYEFVKKFEDRFGESICWNNINQLHSIWKEKTLKTITI